MVKVCLYAAGRSHAHHSHEPRLSHRAEHAPSRRHEPPTADTRTFEHAHAHAHAHACGCRPSSPPIIGAFLRSTALQDSLANPAVVEGKQACACTHSPCSTKSPHARLFGPQSDAAPADSPHTTSTFSHFPFPASTSLTWQYVEMNKRLAAAMVPRPSARGYTTLADTLAFLDK